MPLWLGGSLAPPVSNREPLFALHVTPTDEVWAATPTQVTVYRDGHWRQTEPPLQYTGFEHFAWYRGQLWGGGVMLAVHDAGRWRTIGNAPFALVSALAADNHGRLWVGTMADGLWYTNDGQTWQALALPSQGTSIGALWVDARGDLWVSDRGKRPVTRPVYRWREGVWDPLPLPTSAAAAFRHITGLTTDDDRVWAGSSTHGVWCWEGQHWTHWSGTRIRLDGLPGNTIYGLHVDVAHRIWAATHNGLGVFVGHHWYIALVALTQPHGAEPTHIWTWSTYAPRCSHHTPNGRLWVGMTDGQIGWIDTTQQAPPSVTTMLLQRL